MYKNFRSLQKWSRVR